MFPVPVGRRAVQHPKGVVGVLAPWNYPLTLAVSDAMPALLAGNAAVLKPDVQTTPDGALGHRPAARGRRARRRRPVVTGEGPVVGPMVIDRVDYVMFTGSTAWVARSPRAAASGSIGCSLELGGKNAMIVRADADIDRAAEIAVAGMLRELGPAVHLDGAHLRARPTSSPPFLEAFADGSAR